MKRTALTAVALVTGTVAWSSAQSQDPIALAIEQSLSEQRTEHEAGVATLRSHGQEGLDALLEAHEAEGAPATLPWTQAIDATAAQKDALWSGLYWNTDLQVAKDEATRTGKPILSLRLLGDLRDTYSCANSRFFRSVLYANPQVAEQMRDDFVLHWSSERAVPQITIDFGDGRTMHRTITGNSIHYVLDAQGNPLDAIPGLMSTPTFQSQLRAAHDLHATIQTSYAPASRAITQHHREARDRNLKSLNRTTGQDWTEPLLGRRPVATEVGALRAIPIAVGKGIVEAPLARTFLPKSALPAPDITPEDVVPEMAMLHPHTREHIASLHPELSQTERAAMIQRFESDLGRDSAFNTLVLHTRIHHWFVEAAEPSFETLNRRVYAELFETPASDPWLGLHEEDVFTGLPGGGI